MASDTSTNLPHLPTAAERRRMSAYAASKAVVAAYHAALAELERRGQRAELTAASELLGHTTKGDVYHPALQHLQAVDVWGISSALSRDEAIRRMNLLEPPVAQLAARAKNVQDPWRNDAEMTADAISELLRAMSESLVRYDVKAISGYLTRYPDKRGATKSALIDLNRWLNSLEASL